MHNIGSETFMIDSYNKYEINASFIINPKTPNKTKAKETR